MRKIETIWHHLLVESLTRKSNRHTQKEIAARFNYSLSTVNHALAGPAGIGAVRKESKFFVLADFEKLLYFWASQRNLEKDIVYRTRVDIPVFEIEGLVPAESIYAGYSSARRILGNSPADYDKVYFYLEPQLIDSVKLRYPPNTKSPANVIVLKPASYMTDYENITTIPQTFVDLWNLKDWYARDFTQALKEKMHGLLS